MLKKWLPVSFTALCVIALGILPAITSQTSYLDILFLVFLFVILAQSWNILGGYTGQVSLGHAAFFGTGALVTRLLWLHGMQFCFAFVLGGLAAVALGAIIGLPALRLKGIYFSIGTLGLAMILQIVIGNTFPDVSFLKGTQMAGYSLISRYYLALGIAVLVCVVVFFLMRSKMGLGMLAVREDEVAASSSGISVFKHKLLALGLSSLFAGLAGGIYAFYYTSYYYYAPFALDWSFNPVLIAFIGGVGSISGPVIGAFVFQILSQIFALKLGNVHVMIFGAIFVVTVLLLPGGLYELGGMVRRMFSRAGKVKETRRFKEIFKI
jgi:branched-chain amino acid transport system permease protein